MLLQVLLGAGLTAMIGMAMASLISDMWKQHSSLEAKRNEMTFAETLRQRLVTSTLCRANMVNKSNFSPSQDRELQIILQDGAPAVHSGSRLDSWKILIERLYVTNLKTAISSVDGQTTYSGDIRFQGEELANSKMKYKEKFVGVLFFKVQDSSRDIVDCYLAESSDNVLENTCRSLGGRMVDSTCDLSSLRKQICEDMQGLWTDGKCDYKTALSAAGTCPVGQSAAGFDAEGKVNCRPSAVRVCTFTAANDGNPRNPTTCCTATESSSCAVIGSSPGGGGDNYWGTRPTTQLCSCSQ